MADFEDDYEHEQEEEEEYYDDDEGGGDYEDEPAKRQRFASPLPPPSSSSSCSSASPSIARELVAAVDISSSAAATADLTKLSRSACPTSPSAQQLLLHSLQLFSQLSSSSPSFSAHFKALAALIKAVDKHQNDSSTGGEAFPLDLCLKRALYQCSALARANEKHTLLLSALIRDKCVKKVDDAKYLLTMLSLRTGAVSGLKMLVKSYPRTQPAKAAGRVSSSYYRGREALLANQPQLALQCFSDAYGEIPFTTTPTTTATFRNKRRIFHRLLALRLVYEGKTPTRALLAKFDSLGLWDGVYAPLLVLAKQGDEAGLMRQLDHNRDYLTKMDLWAYVRTGLQAVARQHVVRIVFHELDRKQIIDLRVLASLSCFNGDGDVDRLTYVLADLFSRGLLTGYMTLLSLVLPKGDKPFKTLGSAVERAVRRGLI